MEEGNNHSTFLVITLMYEDTSLARQKIKILIIFCEIKQKQSEVVA